MMDPDLLNPPDESKIAENSTIVFDPTKAATDINLENPDENSAPAEIVPKADHCTRPAKPERRCSQLAHILPSRILSECGEKCDADSKRTIVNPDSADLMIELNILGGNPSNCVVFPSKTAQDCPLQVISTSTYQNSAITRKHSEVPYDVEMKPCPSDGGSASSSKACEETIPNYEETSLSVIYVSDLSSNDGLLIVRDSEDRPDDRSQNEIPFCQEYGRVGDDAGGGQDREDMSMSHPGNSQQGSQVIPDEAGNLRILVRKSKPLLGIAIEGGANTRHPLPRIININENGAAYDAGGLQVGQLILEVDGHKVEGMHHQEVARLIAESFAQRDKPHIEFLVVEAKKSNLEPKPTALIFLEA